MKTKSYYEIFEKMNDLECTISVIQSISDVLSKYSPENIHEKPENILNLIDTLHEKINLFEKEYNNFENIIFKEFN